MGAQNFIFAPKLLQTDGFQRKMLHFGTEIFQQKNFQTNFLTQPINFFGGERGEPLPSATKPLYVILNNTGIDKPFGDNLPAVDNFSRRGH